MSELAYKARSLADSTSSGAPARLFEVEADEDVEDDPYPFGWRERWRVRPDGSETLVRTALTSDDLLDPKEGDCVPEDTVHRDITEDVAGIVKLREDESTVAVWRNLKLDVKIPRVVPGRPGATYGPAPDLCVIDGVRDPKRRRKSFRLGKVSGRLRLVMEVVSERSKEKDLETLPEIYAQLGAEEYLVLQAEGDYIDEVFGLTAWRREASSGRLRPVKPDSEGRLHLRTVGLLLGTAEGRGLVIWDAATGERQRPPLEEVSFQRARAAHAEEARKKAEQEKKEMVAELEQLRAQVSKPPS